MASRPSRGEKGQLLIAQSGLGGIGPGRWSGSTWDHRLSRRCLSSTKTPIQTLTAPPRHCPCCYYSGRATVDCEGNGTDDLFTPVNVATGR